MKNSYGEILKSTGIVGGVQVAGMAFSLIRNKVAAVVVGTAGFGVLGLYTVYLEMLSQFSSLGLNQSGVRQIARNPQDAEATAKCIWTFRNTSLLFAGVVSVLSMLFSRPISVAVFGSDRYVWGIVVVSAAVFFRAFSDVNIAILNGLRQLRKLGLGQILGNAAGTLLAIGILLLSGIGGLSFVPLFGAVAVATATFIMVRRTKIRAIRPESRAELKNELKPLIAIGLGFSVSAAVASVSAYLSRSYLLGEYGLEAVGIYQSAWTVSNIYVGTILTAMGIDFVPRIMKFIGDRAQLDRICSEQMTLGVILSGAGILFILAFSPLLLNILYSAEFITASPIIRWQVLGVALRVFGFVFGYIIMAHRKPVIYTLAQIVIHTSDYLLLVVFSRLWGFDALGINYFVSYLLYFAITFTVCNRMFGIRLGRLTLRSALVEWLFIAAVWIVTSILPTLWGMFSGAIILSIYLVWMVRSIRHNMNIDIVGYLKGAANKIWERR